MLFSKSLVLGLTFVVSALAQEKLAFTSVPTAVQAGSPTVVTWSGGDGSPVTIELRQGPSTDLKPVGSLFSGTGTSFTWTPEKSLPVGSNYALVITQGSSVNYSGLITLSGGSPSSAASSIASSASSATSAAASSASVSVTSALSARSSASPSVNITATVPSTTLSVTASRNSTAITTLNIPFNSTITSGVSGASTGVIITTNSTLNRATLSNTASTTKAASPTAGSNPSGAVSGTGSPSAAGASTLASPLALVFTALMAIVYFG